MTDTTVFLVGMFVWFISLNETNQMTKQTR